MGTHVTLPIEELTNRQLHLHLIDLLNRQAGTLNRLDTFMTNLSQSVEDLTGAVDAIGVRFNEILDPLLAANADLRSQVQALLDADVIEDAEQAAALQAAMDAQDQAAAQIQEQVTELNAIGTTPEPSPEEPPADQPPADQPPAEEPPTEQPPA